MPLVIAVCLGEPVEVEWKSQKVLTGIFKTPVEGKVKVRRDNYRQADLSVHGGAHKAVYAYPSEHYEFWQSKLEAKLPPGSFGGNLTFRELLEDSVKIGDRFAIGSCILRVTQPRMPCYKLGIKFGDSGIVKHFFESGYWGFYLAVEQEGELQSSDEIRYLGGDGHDIAVSDVTKLLLDKNSSEASFKRILSSHLAPQMKEFVQNFGQQRYAL
ncbi:MAG: MOSC domain-containing protein [Candidatus Melainabacteria bacterium]|jgi:MOSC domain-containing protein YiiM|nr:MAG: MOSC domain-containing protein [Candidatus Melainabacteria bacterium]